MYSLSGKTQLFFSSKYHIESYKTCLHEGLDEVFRMEKNQPMLQKNRPKKNEKNKIENYGMLRYTKKKKI